MQKPIYLDYNATTPTDPIVFETMLPYFQEEFGNSVSAGHSYGWNAEKAVEKARQQVATLINCEAKEIFFTAGATESNNWVIRGLIDRLKREDPSQNDDFIEIISSPIEHSSVIKTLKWAERQNVRIHWVTLNKQGELNLQEVESLITPKTKLMSFMWVNNEIGTINPMKELASIARKHKIYLHSDATQALGKVTVDLQDTLIDMLSFSGHKIYGPKGIGVLYLRNKNPKVEIDPLLFGGGHERGHRSGTINVPSVVGLGCACELITNQFSIEIKKMRSLQKDFWSLIQKEFPTARLNGPELENRSANNLNITFLGYQVPPSFAEIAVSRGSACHSSGDSVNASPVLKAIGLTTDQSEKTLRISLGRWTDLVQIQKAVEVLKKELKPIRT